MKNETQGTFFHIKIKRPAQTVYSGDIAKLKVPTSVGDIYIGPDHCTLFQVLNAGWIELWPMESIDTLRFLISGGILELINNAATLTVFELAEAHQRQELEALRTLIQHGAPSQIL